MFSVAYVFYDFNLPSQAKYVNDQDASLSGSSEWFRTTTEHAYHGGARIPSLQLLMVTV